MKEEVWKREENEDDATDLTALIRVKRMAVFVLPPHCDRQPAQCITLFLLTLG